MQLAGGEDQDMRKTLFGLFLFLVSAPAQAADFYVEAFTGTAGARCLGWYDVANNARSKASLQYSGNTNSAVLTGQQSFLGYGEAYSVTITANAVTYPYFNIKINSLTTGTCWMAGLGTFVHNDFQGTLNFTPINPDCQINTTTGYFSFDLGNAVSRAGKNTFCIVLISGIKVGASAPLNGNKVEFGYIKISDSPTQPVGQVFAVKK
jgi:hypothetical protein